MTCLARFSLESFIRKECKEIKRWRHFQEHYQARWFFQFLGGRQLLEKWKGTTNFLEGHYPACFWRRHHLFAQLEEAGAVRAFVDDFIQGNHGQLVRTQKELALVSVQAFSKFAGGHTILNAHRCSPQAVFAKVYPELDPGYPVTVHDPDYQKRLFLDGLLGHYEGVQTVGELEEIIGASLARHPGGFTLLNLHQGSPQAAFQASYPEFSFSFKRTWRGYWAQSTPNTSLHLIMKHYQIKDKQDWYRLSIDQVTLKLGKAVPKRILIKLLENWLPEENWEYDRFSERISKKSRQKFLGVRLKELFPGVKVLEEYCCRYEDKTYTFDFYIPDKSLLVEYQGEQHYFPVLKWLDHQQQMKRDLLKKQISLQNNLKLAYIPYWWDLNSSSLQQYISQ